MVDFKKRLEELEARTGYCSIREKQRDTVPGLRSGEEISLFYVIEGRSYGKGMPNSKYVIRFLNGSTGCEEFSVDDLLRSSNRGMWAICAGGDRYQRVDVDGDRLLEKLHFFKRVIEPTLRR